MSAADASGGGVSVADASGGGVSVADASDGVTDRILAGPHGPLPVRVYAPESAAGPGLVWLHGGGFGHGDLDMPEADAVAHALAAAGVTVVSVDYRLAPTPEPAQAPDRPRAVYPVASDEAAFAFRWASETGLASGPWALGGASAGGNLAAGAILRLIDPRGPVPTLAVLAYPTLHAVQRPHEPALAALLDARGEDAETTAAAILGMYENYVGAPAAGAEVYAVPGEASIAQLTAFPPTVVITDELDALRTSAEAFVESLRTAGVAVELSLEPGVGHGHLNRPELPAFASSIDLIAERILAL